MEERKQENHSLKKTFILVGAILICVGAGLIIRMLGTEPEKEYVSPGRAVLSTVDFKSVSENTVVPVPDEYKYLSFSQGLAPKISDGFVGFIDITGTFVIEPAYEDVSAFGANGLAAVKRNGKWGYINTTGETVIDFIYDDADAFGENGLATVILDGSSGLVDGTGTTTFDR